MVRSGADLCVGLFHSGGSFHIRGYEPILSLLLFVSALALHSRQLDLKLRLDFLWAVQVRKCMSVCVCACETGCGLNQIIIISVFIEVYCRDSAIWELLCVNYQVMCGGFIFIDCQLSVLWQKRRIRSLFWLGFIWHQKCKKGLFCIVGSKSEFNHLTSSISHFMYPNHSKSNYTYGSRLIRFLLTPCGDNVEQAAVCVF